MEQVAISNIMQPKLQTSLRSSYGRSKTSGAIQLTLPTVVLYKLEYTSQIHYFELKKFEDSDRCVLSTPCFCAFIIHQSSNSEIADRN